MGIALKIDLTGEQMNAVTALLQKYVPDRTVWAFGARIKFTSRPQSDLDLVVFTQPGEKARIHELKEAFDESDLPFRVDTHDWHSIPQNFKKIIEEEYMVIQ